MRIAARKYYQLYQYMQLKQQLKVITNAAQSLKGEDIVSIKVSQKSADIEAIIIVSGRSTQHVRSLANNLKMEAKRLNMKIVGIEGMDAGEWVLVDLAEVVVHIMRGETRDFYQLEELWSKPNKKPPLSAKIETIFAQKKE